MKTKGIIDEVYTDFKYTSMYISVPSCSVMCWKELGLKESICQNSHLLKIETLNIEDEYIINRYLNNPITKAIIFSGMDSMDSIDDIIEFIRKFREKSIDPIVLYTGRYEYEVTDKINKLKEFSNIIIKFGRYNPNLPSRYDEILGITLVSNNQYSKKIEDL